MKKWKLVLDVQEREIKNVKTKEVRDKEVFIIVTNDKLNLILGEWIKSESIRSNEGSLEINGETYKKLNGNSTYHRNISSVLDTYVERFMIFSPNKDIKSIKDVVDLYNSCLDKIKEFENSISQSDRNVRM